MTANRLKHDTATVDSAQHFDRGTLLPTPPSPTNNRRQNTRVSRGKRHNPKYRIPRNGIGIGMNALLRQISRYFDSTHYRIFRCDTFHHALTAVVATSNTAHTCDHCAKPRGLLCCHRLLFVCCRHTHSKPTNLIFFPPCMVIQPAISYILGVPYRSRFRRTGWRRPGVLMLLQVSKII